MVDKFCCPHCGKEIYITKGRQKARSGMTFEHSQPWEPKGLAPLPETVRHAPRPQNLESDYLVQVYQSGMTTLVSLPLSIGITLWQEWPWFASLVIVSIVLALFWLILLFVSYAERLMWSAEKVLNVDINQDGYKGQPETHVYEIHSKSEQGYKSVKIIDGIDYSKLRIFARGVLNGRGLTEAEWCGGGKLFSAPQYREMLKKFEGAGFVAKGQYRNSTYELTASGRAWFRKVL